MLFGSFGFPVCSPQSLISQSIFALALTTDRNQEINGRCGSCESSLDAGTFFAYAISRLSRADDWPCAVTASATSANRATTWRKCFTMSRKGNPTFELTRRRESKQPSPHRVSYETRSRRSRPTICWPSPSRSRIKHAIENHRWNNEARINPARNEGGEMI